MKVEKNKSLKYDNTFGIDVNALQYVKIYDEQELKSLLEMSEFRKEKKLVLGGGSNILLTEDFNGIVIKNAITGIKIIYEDKDTVLVKAGAGVVWNDLVLFSVEKNLGGIENLIQIPGTVGAAPIQNIGAYGVELKDTFHSLKGIFTDTCEESVYEKDECRFGYRDSIFKTELKGKFIITYVILTLVKNPKPILSYGSVKDELDKLNKTEYSIKDISDVIAGIRKAKLPDPVEIGNAGSFFKNPVVNNELFKDLKKQYPDLPGFSSEKDTVKIPAGWLIEKCGWKGKRIKDAGVHAQQALVLVNYGNSTGNDMLSLAGEIKISVYKTFGIELTEEVNII